MSIVWRDVEGYNGRYQVSYYGKVRSVYKNGTTRLLTLNPKHQRNNGLIVRLSKDGRRKEYYVHSLVAWAFLGKANNGEVVYHKNGVLTDNIATNLKYITRQDLGKITGAKGRRRPVAKIDAKGDIIDFYSSARKAAQANYLSYQTVIDRCNGKVKSALAPDGYAYAWEDCDYSLVKAIDKVNIYRQEKVV